MVHYHNDYTSAKIEEIRVFPYLRYFFNSPNMERTPTQYDQYDFTDASYNYEMKTRFNVKRDMYDTTLIQSDKFVPRGKYMGKPVMLIFNFTDYLCCIEYDRAIFDTFLTTEFARQKDHVQVSSPHTYIPKDHLKTICKWDTLVSCDNCGQCYPRDWTAILEGDETASNLVYCPVCIETEGFEIAEV